MLNSSVLLANGTVGSVLGMAHVGESVCVTLHNQNGLPVSECGTVEEVLLEEIQD